MLILQSTNKLCQASAVVCLLLSAAWPRCGQAQNSADQSAEPAYKRMPWHLVDVWWNLGQDAPFESYSIDVTIGHDVPSDVKLYIAPIGLGHLSKTPFYGGIQTQTDGYTKQNQRLRKLGPGLIMSMWGQRELEAIRPSVGGFCQSSGHEGDFISVRRPYSWKKGTYTYKIVRMDREIVADKPYTWVGGFVYSHAAGENVFIGALRFPGERLVLAGRIASFVEIYGRAIPVDKIPKLTVTLGDLKVNGRRVEVVSAVAVYPQGVPDFAEALAGQEGRVVIDVGDQVKGRTQRRVRLLGEGVGGSK